MSDDSHREEVIRTISQNFIERNTMDPELFKKYHVKRGLRNSDGTGVLAGITKVSNVHGYVLNEGDKMPVEGRLTLRGHEIRDLIQHAIDHNRFGFEGVSFLLLMGALPEDDELARFRAAIDRSRELPYGFTAESIMKAPTRNIMNLLERSVSLLYAYDENAESLDPVHEVEVAISLLSRLPRIMVLGYHAERAAFHGESMIMHRYVPGHSTAETILSMLRPDREFTHEEAVMLDILMMLHAEHGGGNNSTFVCRALTSAGTDPYSAYAGAIGSLKGFRHGGANIKVVRMFDEIKEQVADWSDEGQVGDYLRKIVAKEAYDRTGLVYGMGHAVYTLSDPRALACRHYARKLAEGTEYEKEFDLIDTVVRISPEIIAKGRGTDKAICANIDMYTGLVYKMLGIPSDLVTPLFACSRMAGWAAHRFEELVSGKRIMRPAYKSIL
ncbi:MAG: citrate synthase [Coriobacteriales bacterium]|jgi:citrate synthase